MTGAPLSSFEPDTRPVDLVVAETEMPEFLMPSRRQRASDIKSDVKSEKRSKGEMLSKGETFENLVTVTDLATELGISARTLRFYEDKGLIAPRRVGAARVYSSRERARMIVILRGKELGFSIREIKTYLDLYDADPKHETQTRALLLKIADRRLQLEQKRRAIEQALLGLDDLERDAQAILKRANARGKKTTPAKATTATLSLKV